jgi:uncharacterized membrane protein
LLLQAKPSLTPSNSLLMSMTILLFGQPLPLLQANRPQLNIRIVLPALPEMIKLVASYTIESGLNLTKLARLLPASILHLSMLGLVMRQLHLLLKLKRSTLP